MTSTLPPPNSTALAALPVAVLDLETTGLDVRRDHVVQVGVLHMQGARRADAPRIDRLVRPRIPIPAAATAIHGIDERAVAQAPTFAELAPDLHEAIDGRVVVGHHIAFDLAVLRHEAARAGLRWREPPALDVGLLLGALEPTLADLSLEGVTRWLGLRIEQRHSALGDAEAAGAAFAALLPRLRDADVRTLGEALSFAARRNDLVLQQAQSGWHAVPGEAPGSAPPPEPPRIDSYVFERTLGDVMSSPPVVIHAGASLHEAARAMIERRIGALLVGEAGERPRGIVTERDLLRAAASGTGDPRTTCVADVMSAPVECMQADEMLYRALGRMDRLGVRHLCVADAEGAAIGMVSQRDLLQFRARGALEIGDAVAHATDAHELAAAFGRVPAAAERLVMEGVGGVEVARVVASELRAVTARSAELALQALGRDAPAPWCVLVLGSGGRGESLLAADQDNALVHGGSAGDDAWFADFGKRLAGLLDESGVPLCKGGVMAANAPWRGDVLAWRARVESWLQRARPEDLLNIDIFFDLAPAAGEARLAHSLHREAVAAASQSRPFLGLLAASLGGLLPLLGLFGRLRSDGGRIDLKRCSLLPIVSLARGLALRVGSTERSTPGRLRDAASAGRLSEADAAELVELHERTMTLVLGQQLRDLEEGVRPSNRVALSALGRAEARALAQQLRRLEQVVENARAAMSA